MHAMRAVTFHISIPRYLLAKTVGRYSDAVLYGNPSGLNLVDRPVPALPDASWVRAEVIASGICGTDLSTLSFRASTALEPFGSFPAVLGHEVLARVVEVGADVRSVAVGQRIAINPFLSCAARGHDTACRSCADGQVSTCERAGDVGELHVGGAPLAPGTTMGYHRDIGGGWSEQVVAHQDHVFAVPDAVTNRAAVLVEPLAIAMHAVLRARVASDQTALVIGSGPIALGMVWALRASGFQGTLVA
jgi:threonine dehydrogenase-like Zn-dependent dehydrogenase